MPDYDGELWAGALGGDGTRDVSRPSIPAWRDWDPSVSPETNVGYCSKEQGQQEVVYAQGVCGANIDDWFLDEVMAQILGWTNWAQAHPGSVSVTDYMLWANGNQRYKDPEFFEFSKDTDPPCGTKEGALGCGRSVTLCGKCIRSAILGNIMYGMIGRLPVVMAGGRVAAKFKLEDLRNEAVKWKKRFRQPIDEYDDFAYAAGYQMYDGLEDRFLLDTCNLLDEVLKDNPGTLCQKNKNGWDDLSRCKPCTQKTKEKRHGGKESQRYWP